MSKQKKVKEEELKGKEIKKNVFYKLISSKKQNINGEEKLLNGRMVVRLPKTGFRGEKRSISRGIVFINGETKNPINDEIWKAFQKQHDVSEIEAIQV
jgi:hypothetical protein